MNRPLFGCAALALAVSMPASAKAPTKDEKEMQRFTLTSAFFEKMFAIQEKVMTMEESHPEKGKEGDAAERQHRGKSDDTLDGMVKKTESVPQLANIITAHGLTVRQYIVGTMVLLQASMYAAMKKQMPDMQKPEGLNMTNVAFVEAHQAELEKLQQHLSGAAGHTKKDSKPEVEQGEQKDGEQ